MLKFFVFFLMIISLVFSCKKGKSLSFPEETHLCDVKQLTFGGENAEAYLSFNEKQLVYQAKVPPFSCDQIFIMDINGAKKQLLSTGKGRTTCSYFLPGDSLILYSSTHLAGDECPPPPDYSLGYVWKLYDSYDIFVVNLKREIVKRLTDTPGYDAEATVSPKGDKIVFTSMRDGDPEIYTMNLDGSDQKRLTFSKGYDGGAFFSLNGTQIVYRASRPTTNQELRDYGDLVRDGLVRPTTLELYVMNADGTNQRKITNFGKASFAPFFHPDEKRIIFSSNINSESGRNFDLYMINIDGSGLEQITYNDSFDGFPVFTRDGKHLIFASNRFNKVKGETNIFIAEWTD